MHNAAKVCRYCGKDVSQVRRTRDADGNYYCDPCYADAARVYRLTKPANSPAATGQPRLAPQAERPKGPLMNRVATPPALDMTRVKTRGASRKPVAKGNRVDHVSWQASLVIVSAITIPVALIAPLAGAGRVADEVCTAVLSTAVAVGVLAVLSRLYQVKSPGIRAYILKRIGLGLGLMATALILTLVSYFYLHIPFMGRSYFLAPTGFYMAGMTMIAKALPPAG